MKLHYAGKFSGDERELPQREHPEGSVPFNEPEDMEKLSLIANLGALFVLLILAVPFLAAARHSFPGCLPAVFLGFVCSIFSLFPHELLHALCFRHDVRLYTDLPHGLLFVTGPEDMSKGRFILMSLLPNLVFGVLPYAAFFMNHSLAGAGAFGLICISMGFGDYMNVYHALCQMPPGARTYLSGMHSYWFLPK